MYQSTSDPSRKFGSKFRGRKYDEMHQSQDPAVSKEEPRTLASGEAKFSKKEASAPDNNTEGMHMAEGSQEANAIHPVVAQHGKAHKVTVKHDHANNKHQVMSEHPDGYAHHADHDSAEEAHAEGSRLGGSEPDVDDMESPETEAMGGGGGGTETMNVRKAPRLA